MCAHLLHGGFPLHSTILSIQAPHPTAPAIQILSFFHKCTEDNSRISSKRNQYSNQGINMMNLYPSSFSNRLQSLSSVASPSTSGVANPLIPLPMALFATTNSDGWLRWQNQVHILPFFYLSYSLSVSLIADVIVAQDDDDEANDMQTSDITVALKLANLSHILYIHTYIVCNICTH